MIVGSGTTKDTACLEGNLGAREGAESTTVGRRTTTSTASTTTTTVTTKTSTTTTIATETSTASTAATTATATESTTTTLSALGLLSSKVQAAGTTSEVGAVPGNSSLGLLDGRELNVTETLGLARLAIGGETDRENLSALGEGTADIILSGSEGQVR